MTYTDQTHPGALPAVAVQSDGFADRIAIGLERPGDEVARELLLDRAFGRARFRKTCEKLRVGRLPARGLSLVARRLGGSVVGTVRLWHVEASGVPALMLGPLAVDAGYRRFGIGARLMEAAIDRARSLGHAAILLIGDVPFYDRFGFARRHTLALRMPGPIEDDRFLGLELKPGALAEASGLVKATGSLAPPSRRQAGSLRRAA